MSAKKSPAAKKVAPIAKLDAAGTMALADACYQGRVSIAEAARAFADGRIDGKHAFSAFVLNRNTDEAKAVIQAVRMALRRFKEGVTIKIDQEAKLMHLDSVTVRAAGGGRPASENAGARPATAVAAAQASTKGAQVAKLGADAVCTNLCSAIDAFMATLSPSESAKYGAKLWETLRKHGAVAAA